MFASAAGVTLPWWSNAPPMIANPLSRSGSAGSSDSASATFVSGPVATSSTSPGRSRAVSTSSRAASRSEGARDAGGSSASPRPRAPCTTGNAMWSRTSGRSGTFRDLHVGVPAELEHGQGVLAWCGRRRRCPSRSSPPISVTSGEASAYRIASASSTPVSTSRISGIGSMAAQARGRDPMRPAVELRRGAGRCGLEREADRAWPRRRDRASRIRSWGERRVVHQDLDRQAVDHGADLLAQVVGVDAGRGTPRPRVPRG